MPKATTPTGTLKNIEKGYLQIPGLQEKIYFNNLPELTDSKSAVYNSEGIIGRSSPLHTYSHSDTRQISLQLHFLVIEKSDIEKNLRQLRAIQSCVYPREGTGGASFSPPCVCKLKFGDFLAKDQDLCVVLQQYSVRVPTEVAFDEETLCPYKFDVDTSWWVVYTSTQLPVASRIMNTGR